MEKLGKIVDAVLGLPKSIYLSFYYFPIKQAIKLPFLVSRKVRIASTGGRGAVSIPIGNRIKIGFSGSYGLGRGNPAYWCVGDKGNIRFNGNATFGRGTQIICNGKMILGSNFSMNANSILNASNHIEIGNDFLAGWGVEIIDGDGHKIYGDEKNDNSSENVCIGNHVWCAKHVSILKGTSILNDSVCAASAVISRKFDEPNLLIGGVNKILKRNIMWEQ